MSADPDATRLSEAMLCLAKMTRWHRRALEHLEQSREQVEFLSTLQVFGANLAALQSQLAVHYSEKCAKDVL